MPFLALSGKVCAGPDGCDLWLSVAEPSRYVSFLIHKSERPRHALVSAVSSRRVFNGNCILYTVLGVHLCIEGKRMARLNHVDHRERGSSTDFPPKRLCLDKVSNGSRLKCTCTTHLPYHMLGLRTRAWESMRCTVCAVDLKCPQHQLNKLSTRLLIFTTITRSTAIYGTFYPPNRLIPRCHGSPLQTLHTKSSPSRN